MRIFAAALILMFVSGCAFIKPTTKVTVNPLTKSLSLYNTKDVDVALNGLSIEWAEDSGVVAMESLVISDKASPVVEANVAQMLAFAEQQRAANEGIIGALAELRGVVGVLADLLRGSITTIDTPIGSGSRTLGTRPG